MALLCWCSIRPNTPDSPINDFLNLEGNGKKSFKQKRQRKEISMTRWGLRSVPIEWFIEIYHEKNYADVETFFSNLLNKGVKDSSIHIN